MSTPTKTPNLFVMCNALFELVYKLDQLRDKDEKNTANSYLNQANNVLSDILDAIENDPQKDSVINMVANTLYYMGYCAVKKEVLGNGFAPWTITPTVCRH